MAVAGAVGGVVAATLLSAFAPVGEARLADPDPGLAFDWPVAGLGALAAVAVVLARVSDDHGFLRPGQTAGSASSPR